MKGKLIIDGVDVVSATNVEASDIKISESSLSGITPTGNGVVGLDKAIEYVDDKIDSVKTTVGELESTTSIHETTIYDHNNRLETLENMSVIVTQETINLVGGRCLLFDSNEQIILSATLAAGEYADFFLTHTRQGNQWALTLVDNITGQRWQNDATFAVTIAYIDLSDRSGDISDSDTPKA